VEPLGCEAYMVPAYVTYVCCRDAAVETVRCAREVEGESSGCSRMVARCPCAATVNVTPRNHSCVSPEVHRPDIRGWNFNFTSCTILQNMDTYSASCVLNNMCTAAGN
jgi:hypothetical protein